MTIWQIMGYSFSKRIIQKCLVMLKDMNMFRNPKGLSANSLYISLQSKLLRSYRRNIFIQKGTMITTKYEPV